MQKSPLKVETGRENEERRGSIQIVASSIPKYLPLTTQSMIGPIIDKNGAMMLCKSLLILYGFFKDHPMFNI